jgi:mono/diheme cytochrome c family protein
MSAQPTPDPRGQRPLSDEELIHAHEQALADKADDQGHYKLLPLVLLFAMGGLIFFGGTYLNLYSGHFDPRIFDERRLTVEPTVVAKRDPIAFGKKQYESLCIQCHQPTGLGVPGAFPPLAKSEWVNGSDERMIRIVLHGLTGPISVAGGNFGATPMPAVGPGGAGWNDEQIAAVITYVRTNKEWGNNGTPVEPEKVTAIREKVGTRGPWTAAELEKIP